MNTLAVVLLSAAALVILGFAIRAYERHRDRRLTEQLLGHEKWGRRTAEEALRESKNHLCLVMEQLPAVLWTVDRDLRFTSSLGAMLPKLNLRQDQVVGISLFDYFQTRDPEFPAIAAHRRALSGETMTFEQAWAGMAFHSHLEPLRDAEGRIVGVIGIAYDVTERKKVLRELEESENRYRLLAENASDIITRFDPAGIHTYVSPACRAILGYEPEELLGRSGYEFLHPDHLEEIRGLQARILSSSESVKAALQYRHKSGRYIWLETTGRAIRDPSTGQPQGIICVSRDITERKRAEERLRASETRFRSLAESANDAIIMADQEGRILYWNKSAEQLFGYREEEILGKPLTVLMPERYRESHVRGLARAAASGETRLAGKTMEWSALTRNGREFPVELSLAAWESEGKRYYTGIVRDLTERRRAEASMLFQANILSQVNDAVVAADRAHRITYWNNGAEQLFRFKAVEALGRPAEEMTRPRWASPQDKRNALKSLAKTGRWHGESLCATKHGEERDIESSVSVLKNDGRTVGYLSVIRDITERKKLEGMVLHAEKLAAMGQIASGLAHELTTPLTVILGSVDIALDRLKKEGSPVRQLEVIRQQTLRCNELVRKLLMQSRKEDAPQQVFPLEEAVESVLSLLETQARLHKVTVKRDLSPVPLLVSGQKEQIEQVVINLSNNALDAMPKGGTLTVGTASVTEEGRAFARIRVADTGTGIPPEARDKIFAPFFTTKDPGKGTGLGLWLAQEITFKHGGNITFSTQEGKGTVFFVTLPLA